MFKLSQFILWKAVPGKTPGKVDKLPVHPLTGQVCNAHDTTAWVDYGTAQAMSAAFNLGIAFVFTANDPYFFVDIDNRDGTEILQQFPGAYVEVSQSDNGLHIIGRYDGPEPAHKCRNEPEHLELYTSGRFVALTERDKQGNPETVFDLSDIITQHFKPDSSGVTITEWTDKPVPEWRGPDSDDALIKKALASNNSGFSNSATFAQLWNADAEALAKVFPETGNQQRPYDESKADSALAAHLAFWTGKDCERIKRLMLESALRRDKWEREDYLPRTILNAVNTVTKVFGGQQTTDLEVPEINLHELSPARFQNSVPPPVDWIILNVLAKGIVGFLYGEGGTYKSLAALWLIIQRACTDTQLWLGKFQVTKGRSVFLSAEDIEDDLHLRYLAIQNKLPEAQWKAITENCLIMSRKQWLTDKELFIIDEHGKETLKVKTIIKLVTEFNADLVILETYSRIANVDEVDNRLAALAVGALEAIRDATGATVLCIAHISKAARKEQQDTHGQSSLRGAGGLGDNSRFLMWFQAKAASATTGEDIIEVHNPKTFRCKRFPSFKVTANYPVLSVMQGAVAEPGVFDRVVAFVKENPGCTQRQVRENIKGVRSTIVSQALKDAVVEKRIEYSKTEGYRVC